MKLFLYDSKHEQVYAEMDLPSEENVHEIIAFLQKNGILDGRYKDLIVADKYAVSYDEDGFQQITFE